MTTDQLISAMKRWGLVSLPVQCQCGKQVMVNLGQYPEFWMAIADSINKAGMEKTHGKEAKRV